MKKIAEFNYINEFGQTVEIYLIWGGANIIWGGSSQIIFKAFASADECARGNEMTRFFVTIAPDTLIELMTTNGYVGEIISNESWRLALTTAFIADYSQISEDNKRVMTMKSLTDLNAVISEVE